MNRIHAAISWIDWPSKSATIGKLSGLSWVNRTPISNRTNQPWRNINIFLRPINVNNRKCNGRLHCSSSLLKHIWQSKSNHCMQESCFQLFFGLASWREATIFYRRNSRFLAVSVQRYGFQELDTARMVITKCRPMQSVFSRMRSDALIRIIFSPEKSAFQYRASLLVHVARFLRTAFTDPCFFRRWKRSVYAPI